MKLKVKSEKLKVLFLFSLPILFLVAYPVFAQISFLTNLGNFPGGAFTVTMLLNMVRSLACYFIQFAIIAVGISFFVYGMMFLKSRGSAQGFGSAKKSLLWGLVGGLVIFGVFTIILSLAALIGVDYPILTIVQCS